MNGVPDSTPLPTATARAPAAPQTRLNAALWLGATLIACFFAMLLEDSAVFGGQYLPRSNDSLYHARRILDTAIGERGFYEFDERLHVPEGTWIPWPWAYDYTVAQALRVALWLKPALDPMAFIAHVAVFWIAVNAALFLACAQAIGLSAGLRAVAMLGFALSPLIQLSHAVAMIDHHFIELTFVLLSVWLGLRWMHRTDSARAAAALGFALGIAPAFHNGLFILQLPLLGTAFALWMRGSMPSAGPVKTLASVLVAATLLAALPSAALRAGMFDFALLSWFHVYVAACSAATLLFMALRPFTKTGLGLLAGLAAALAVPILTQGIRGALFFSGDFSVLDQITEVHSPFRMFFESWGPMQTAGFYSWLIVAVPALLAYYAWTAARAREPQVLHHALWGVFGLGLLLLQYRFNYFGLFFMIAGPLLALESIASSRQWRPSAALLLALTGFLVVYQPSLRDRLFTIYASGGSTEYAGGLGAFDHLAELCAEEPGIVLANNNDGNAILFHTECSVFVNNFILGPQDDVKHELVDLLMGSRPQDLRRFRPVIDYVFVRVRDFAREVDGVERVDMRNPLGAALLASDEPPEGYELTRTLVYETGDPPEERLYARVFKLTPLPVAGD